ncbi:MAG: hypothetical protein JJU19_08635 [Pararhodobacter sp.]|nr:hypothetical protein [Pararhodobacter sp.]
MTGTPITRTARNALFSLALGVVAVVAHGVLPAAAQSLRSVAPAAGGAQPLSVSQIVQADIRPGWQTDDGRRFAALHLRLADGWRTYWRIPGQAGIAPVLDWSQSQNLARVTVHWPLPEVFDQNGYQSIGYARELILPLELEPRRAGRPIALVGALTIGLCNDTCIPADLSVRHALRGPGAPDPQISAALATTARPATQAGLGQVTCRITPQERGAELTLRATLPRLGRSEHVVMEIPGAALWVSDSRSTREGGDLVATARVMAPQRGPVSFGRDAVAFTIISPERMVEHRGCSGG